MIEKENRRGLVLVITGFILLSFSIILYLSLLLNIRFFIYSGDILILGLGALGLLVFLVGIYSLRNTPRMKGLLILMIGLFLTGGGLYFTRYLLLNPNFIISKSSSIYWAIILTIIGILIIEYGIIQIGGVSH